MDGEKIFWIIVLIAGCAGAAALAQLVRVASFSQPRLFEFRGANVRWVPEERPSWFSKPWEYGRFENEDGSPIEDARLRREIYDVWDAQNRSSNVE